MAKTETLVDTGPLVAYFDRRDEHHAWSSEQMGHLSVPLRTCEAVLSESFHLLERAHRGAEKLITFIERGAVTVPFSYSSHADRVHELLRAYADQPMSFADACLVAMAGERPARRVFTTDADFHVYRTVADAPMDLLVP